MARRVVSDVRAPRPRVSAIAERRPRARAQAGPSIAYYKRLGVGWSTRPATARRVLLRRHRHVDPRALQARSAVRRRRRAAALLAAIDVEVRAAVAAFSMQNPSASVPALARGLRGDARGDRRAAAPSPTRSSSCRSRNSSSWTRSTRRSASTSQAIAAVPGPSCRGSASAVERRADEPRRDSRSTSSRPALECRAPVAWTTAVYGLGRAALGRQRDRAAGLRRSRFLPTRRCRVRTSNATRSRSRATRCATPRSSAGRRPSRRCPALARYTRRRCAGGDPHGGPAPRAAPAVRRRAARADGRAGGRRST